MIAQIIVDVPVNRTNRPFDYRVPTWLSPLIRVGSRVVVPFGPRKLQGYVVGILENPTDLEDNSRLKDVEQVLDDTPPLTPELLKMSEWMSKQYLCPWVTAVQAMIPAVLKGKSEKWLTATDFLDEELCGKSGLLWELLRKRHLPLSEVEKQFPEEYMLVPGWIQSGLLATEYQVTDRITRKQQSFVRCLLDPSQIEEALASLPARAEQMRRVLGLFAHHTGQSFSVQMMREEWGITRSPLKSLEAKAGSPSSK